MPDLALPISLVVAVLLFSSLPGDTRRDIYIESKSVSVRYAAGNTPRITSITRYFKTESDTYRCITIGVRSAWSGSSNHCSCCNGYCVFGLRPG